MLHTVSDLDLRLLRVFLAIVDAGGVSAAQASLGVGQSTLSSQLSTLETRLGFSLCERGRGGFRLTAKGRRFVDMARTALQGLEGFSAQARNMHRQLVGSLAIGLIGNAPMEYNALMGRAIQRFRQRDEAVRLSVLVRGPRELEEMLLRDELQVAVGYFLHRAPALEYTLLFSERQVAYCSASHPFAARAGRIGAQEAGEADWTWRTYPLPQAPLTGRPRYVTSEADNMEAAAILILSGAHLGYLPEHYAAPYVAAGLLHALDESLFSYDVDITMVAKKRARQDDITAAFTDDMRAVL
ncbi:transcriptional regulator, LysR family [Delftia sp. Cs1-4]|uniref:LysR family transcriptional regulator n=1 Tax=Delftia sp. (strain Cs1-4) TaxID=742013 RepID=UPI00020E7B60|nr:LysR family transcriptional regulator [Delftia sp. Cs1-4]AEF88524.1 transcriptional regulator, LysR family [Delftia sp. Cs1-4]